MTKPASPSFAVVRSIGGGENSIAADATLAIAVSPVSGALYVFSRTPSGPALITVFADGANGNAEPSRMLFGSSAHLPRSAFAVNVLAVDDADFLYVTSDSGAISVFSPGASGKAAPARRITDSSAASHIFPGGIALRLH